jgi:hypothetical protein
MGSVEGETMKSDLAAIIVLIGMGIFTFFMCGQRDMQLTAVNARLALLESQQRTGAIPQINITRASVYAVDGELVIDGDRWWEEMKKMSELLKEHKKLNPLYEGSPVAPLPTYPEKGEGMTLKDWGHFERQQAEAMDWFKRVEEVEEWLNLNAPSAERFLRWSARNISTALTVGKEALSERNDE